MRLARASLFRDLKPKRVARPASAKDSRVRHLRLEPGGAHPRSVLLARDGSISCVDRSDQYRRFAQECLEMARTSEGEQTRVVLIQMAQVWFRLAKAHEPENAGAGHRPDAGTKE
jgi:hypothetical protein